MLLWILGIAALVISRLWLIPVYYGQGSRVQKLAAKGAPTAMAALFGLAACLQNGDRYALLIFLGLSVCVAADIMLDVKFLAGGVLFLMGHIFYMTALGGYHAPGWAFVPVFVTGTAVLWLFCRRYLHLFPNRLLFAGVLVYCMALAAVLGFSLPLPFAAPSQRTVLAALGAAMFVVSDMTTCHCVLAKPGLRFEYNSLTIYYAAQFLLGMSAFA